MNHLVAFLRKLFIFKFKSQAKSFSLILLIILCVPFSLNAKQTVEQDSDGDGLSDKYEEQLGTETYLADTDGDGINDGDEVGKNLSSPRDSDGDKRIDALDYDDDNDGLPTILENKSSKYSDVDKDGLMNYLDSDSDNDGVPDGVEAGVLNQDKNLDGIDDAFDIEHHGGSDKNGDGISDNLKLPDFNKNGLADYLDNKVSKGLKTVAAKKTKKKILVINKKVNEKQIAKKTLPKKVTLNRYTDTDNDGLLDSQEIMLGTNPLKRDSDGDTVSDAIEIGMDINAPQDSDHDGKIDALDIDDDNDGVLTKMEDLNKDGSPINDDTDDDGIPNYLDNNDDGDDTLTIAESHYKDTDKDGILDYLDKNNTIKDTKIVAQKITEKQTTSDQPEIVVLFDGDAESLVEASKDDVNEPEELSEIAENLIDNMEKNLDRQQQTEGIETTRKAKTTVAAWSWNLF